jgi:hypothetical protein
MTFTLEYERDNKINFLNDTVTKCSKKVQFFTFRKHANADSVMPSDLCHPSENKYAAGLETNKLNQFLSNTR